MDRAQRRQPGVYKALYVIAFLLFIQNSYSFTVQTETGVDILPEIIYNVDATASDQGAATARSDRTIYDLCTAIGTSTDATLYLPKGYYIFSTTFDGSSYTKIKLVFAQGAIIKDDASNASFTWGGKINALLTQQIFDWGNGSGTLLINPRGDIYPEWVGFSSSASAANNLAYLSIVLNWQRTYGGKIVIPPGNLSINGPILIDSYAFLEGANPVTYGAYADGDYANGNYTRLLCSNDANLFEVKDTTDSDRTDGCVIRNMILDVRTAGRRAVYYDSSRHSEIRDCLVLGDTTAPSYPLVEIIDTQGKGYAYSFIRNSFIGGTWAIDAEEVDTQLPSSRLSDCIINGQTVGGIRGPWQGLFDNNELSGMSTAGSIGFDLSETTKNLIPSNLTLLNNSIENVNGKGSVISGYNIHIIGGFYVSSNVMANAAIAVDMEDSASYNYPTACSIEDYRIDASNTPVGFIGIQVDDQSGASFNEIRNVHFVGTWTSRYKIVDSGNNAQIINYGRIGDGKTSGYGYFKAVRETVTGMSGATVTISNMIPAGVNVISVAGVITTAFGVTNGTTGFQIGDGTTADRFADRNVVSAGSTFDLAHSQDRANLWIYTNNTNIVITAKGGNFDGTGAMSIELVYYNYSPPSE